MKIKNIFIAMYFIPMGLLIFYLIYCLFVPYKFHQNLEKLQLKKATDIIYYEKSIATEYVSQIDIIYNSLPDDIKNIYEKTDWIIVITTNIQKYVKGSDINSMAITNTDRHIIYIKIPSTLQLFSVIYHESGHVIDYYYNFKSLSQGFVNIYNLEKHNYYQVDDCDDYYAISNNFEFFASSLKDYLLYPKHLKDNNPKLYTFFKELL